MRTVCVILFYSLYCLCDFFHSVLYTCNLLLLSPLHLLNIAYSWVLFNLIWQYLYFNHACWVSYIYLIIGMVEFRSSIVLLVYCLSDVCFVSEVLFLPYFVLVECSAYYIDSSIGILALPLYCFVFALGITMCTLNYQNILRVNIVLLLVKGTL